MDDPYADVQATIEGLDAAHQQVMLLRLAGKLNNGREHFDHSPVGYSWLCLACAQAGRGPLVITVAEMFGEAIS